VGWAFLAVSVVGALLTANALRPPRAGLVSGFAFPPGWLVSELPVHAIVLQVGGTLAFWAGGAFAGGSAPEGWVGLALAVPSWCGLVALAVSGARAKQVVAAALPVPQGPSPAGILRLARAWPARPRSVERIRDLDYAGDGKRYHRLDVFRKTGETGAGRPVLLYIHGGAWTIGDKREQGLPMMHHLAELGAVCFTANYRLSPKATWPAHLDDCRLALRWVREHAAEYGGDPARIVVSGGSAGGHLAALVALAPERPADAEETIADPPAPLAGCLSFYGVYDFTDRETGHPPQLLRLLERRVMKALRAEQADVFVDASPSSHVRADAPPFVVVHGRNDTLVPVTTARAFVLALTEVSESPVTYLELPFAQHAFDIFWSARTAALVGAAESFVFSRSPAARET
jgi:acetyl esterase/lipase